jgi:hypothetical protein
VYLLLAYRLQILQPMGRKGPVPEGMTQTLLTNKKQGKNCRSQEFFYFNRKSEEPLENLETSRQ